MKPMDGVTIVDHPLVQHKLTLLRKKDISTKSFRELLKEIGVLLCYEVTRDLPLRDVDIETPLARMKSPQISGKKLVFAPVLRAGVTFADGMLDLVPTARIAHIGLYREPETFVAVEYFFKAPSDLHERLVIVISPVLATANSAVAAVDRLKERGAREIRLVCLLGAPEGVERMRGIHPDVPIWLAAIDQGLDENGFIVPGLGDAGPRLRYEITHSLRRATHDTPPLAHASRFLRAIKPLDFSGPDGIELTSSRGCIADRIHGD
jgi:uracil phosphoribosyltransferase